jgi:3-dehydroquinate dehydratase/shikimate dehydrogenase
MARPLVCVTVTAPTTAELRRRRDAVGDADLVELRLDTVSDPDVAGALEGRHQPVVVTCRPTWEGGQFRGSEEERRHMLEEALDQGADYVDVEWRANFTDVVARLSGRRIVLSMHDFDAMPGDLIDRSRAMRATGAEVIKIAAKAGCLADSVRLLDLAASFGEHERRVLIGMGPAGIATRVLANRFGSAWTYAGAMGGIGQVTPAQLVGQYRFRDLTASSDIYGLTGSPIGHSVSPAMHNAAIQASALDAVYLPLPATDVDDFMAFARAFGLKGASVTIPFKVALADRLDEVYSNARRVGAINTIRFENGRWLGANTDVIGFLRPLDEQRIAVNGRRASILGAGGSARAVAVALASKGAAVTVHARNRERAEAVADLVSGGVGPFPPAAGTWDLLINCTPIGMYPGVAETPMRDGLDGEAGRVVYDLIYNPPTTELLRDAAAAGCHTIGGLDMLVAQAREQFRWWTGIMPEAGVMRAAALKCLSEFGTDEDHIV